EKMMVFYGEHWKEVVASLKNDSVYLSALIERNIRFINDPGDIKQVLKVIQSKIHL
ncbi:MAG: hypothetical protein JNK43_09000, partial [Ignavibacteria bacterium]|nr:hypothetical protein [Ignavibacteria bacterium]